MKQEDDFKKAYRTFINYVRDTIDDNLNVRLKDNKQAQIQYLVDLAASNRAEWAGGTGQPINVVETVWKEEAIDKLRRII